jgi:hypothetical protein
MQMEEIRPDALRRYSAELLAAAEVVCKSPSFRTSPKSCQFLRHIVRHTLAGNADELKERLIGITLLGREASYDTGSDAGVRVRANDVRKRLAVYYSASLTETAYTIDIPPGSYVPRFYLPDSLHDVQSDPLPHEDEEELEAPPAPLAAKLPLQQLAFPTFVALFLCIICMRWQLAQEHPFVTFWQTVFQDHHALLYLPLSRSGGPQEPDPANRLEYAAPLLNLAGQFHAEIGLTRTLTPPIVANEILIVVDGSSASSNDSGPGRSGSDRFFPSEGSRMVIVTSPSGRQIVDRNAANSTVTPYGRAALLTIANGAQRSIHIDGTDDEAIDALIKTMCESGTFPDELIDGFQEGTVTQLVFPIAPRANAVVFHESLPLMHTAMNGPQ